MNITLKCFAGLKRYLPPHAEANAVVVEIDADMSVHQVIDLFKIDREEAYLIILNGVFVCHSERDSTVLKENDTLALWPEVAGG